jgi:hypothetical protein
MSVLTACQEAAVELNQPQPTSLFSTTDPFSVELRRQANKSARAIGRAYEWQALTALQTMTGDGTTTSFALPSDYDRMPVKANVLTSQLAFGLRKAPDLDFWLNLQIYPQIGVPGYWIILGGTMQIRAALASAVTAKFYYIKNTTVSGAMAVQQSAFLADADTFNLPEHLLTLDVIWRWRAQKRMEYAEDMSNFQIALAEEVAKDKGSRTLTVGQRRVSSAFDLPHPAIVV